MWGRATLAIVMSRITMIIAIITEPVMSPRCFTSVKGCPWASVPLIASTRAVRGYLAAVWVGALLVSTVT